MQTTKTEHMEKEYFKGGFTKFPEKIRECDSKAIVQKDKSQYVSPTSKLVFIYLLYYKNLCNNQTPTFEYMKNRFGISYSAYDKAIKELSSIGAIKKNIVEKRNFGVLDIEIIYNFIKDSKFEKFPNLLIDTDVYTNNQKIFLACLWKLFIKDEDVSKYSIALSNRKIADFIYGVGFSKSVCHRLLAELSDKSHGFIPALIKTKDSYRLNVSAIMAIYERNSRRWNEVSMKPKGTIRYPVYEKPVPFDFTYLEQEGCDSVIVENRQERIAPIIKKLTNACETFEEAKARFEKEQEEYED